MSTRKARVELSRRAAWDIELSDQDSHVTCETLEEAERVAHICAAYQQPCELVVCDAYHRVLHRELIHANADQAAQAPWAQIGDLVAILDTQARGGAEYPGGSRGTPDSKPPVSATASSHGPARIPSSSLHARVAVPIRPNADPLRTVWPAEFSRDAVSKETWHEPTSRLESQLGGRASCCWRPSGNQARVSE
ncbi:MAG: hypothetical protein ACLP8S_19915 [Solirubrobacteraceae bacterium]